MVYRLLYRGAYSEGFYQCPSGDVDMFGWICFSLHSVPRNFNYTE